MTDLDRLEHDIRRLAGRAIGDFGLIENRDRILVALSGGKDSFTLLHILESLQKRAPVAFSLVAVTVHPGFPGFQTKLVEDYLRTRGVEHRVVHAPVHKLMIEKLTPDDTPCALCARLKRGVLYTQARNLGCTKIALGHHRDDFISEFAFLDSGKGATLAFGCKGILRSAGDAKFFNNIFSRHTHMAMLHSTGQPFGNHVIDYFAIAHAIPPTRIHKQIRGATHGFHSACNNQIRIASNDGLCRKRNRFKPRTTNFVYRECRNACRQPGSNCRLPRRIHPVAGLQHVAHNHFLNFTAFNTGAFNSGFDNQATEFGYGKRTQIAEYTRHGRGTKGMIAIQQSERNGKVVAAALVSPDDEVMLISTGGVLIRTPVKSIREMSRSTQGVTLINLSEGEKLAGLERVVETDEEE